MEVRHISEGHNLEPLADTVKFTYKDGQEVIYMVFHLVAFALT